MDGWTWVNYALPDEIKDVLIMLSFIQAILFSYTTTDVNFIQVSVAKIYL